MTNKQIDAGDVGPGPTRYRVTHTHDHEALGVGDMVVIAEAPLKNNVLVRCSDFTVHSVYGKHEQFVHLEEIQ